MKLKISFCNTTVLRTDLTRFAPLWGLYTVFLGLIMLMFLGNIDTYEPRDVQLVRSFSELTEITVAINGIYAMLVVMTLFGDMLTPRLCNALHAMPISRDGFYTAHLVAGLLMALVPDCLVFVVAALRSGAAAPAALWLLLATVLQYIFYLGTAMLSVQLAGNRIAFILIYGLMNFVTLLFIWFAQSLYFPMLYGVQPDIEKITQLCPTVAMMGGRSYFWVETTGSYPNIRMTGIVLGNRWIAAGICAGLGLVCMAGAQILYRKRALETAGDFLACKGLRMVFLVLYTLMIGGFFHLIPILAVDRTSLPFLLVGLVVGYFTGLMLLNRRTRVFRKRALLMLAGILAVLALTIGLTLVDVANIVRYVPASEDVEQVSLYVHYNENHTLNLTEPEDIDAIRSYHRNSLEGWQKKALQKLMGNYELYRDYSERMMVKYTLKNGRTVLRTYPVGEVSTPAREAFEPYMSRTELAFGVSEEELVDWMESADTVGYCYYSDKADIEEQIPDRAGFAQAILADCREGNFINAVEDYEYDEQTYCGYMQIRHRVIPDPEQPDAWTYDYVSLSIWPDNVHTYAWLEEQGIMAHTQDISETN